MVKAPVNPFNFGDLALDEGFTDRERELRELAADIRNGQNVVVFAPRRYGKTSLVWRATQELVRRDEVLVAQVDLMRTATKEQLAAKLALQHYAACDKGQAEGEVKKGPARPLVESEQAPTGSALVAASALPPPEDDCSGPAVWRIAGRRSMTSRGRMKIPAR